MVGKNYLLAFLHYITLRCSYCCIVYLLLISSETQYVLRSSQSFYECCVSGKDMEGNSLPMLKDEIPQTPNSANKVIMITENSCFLNLD